MKRKSLLFGMIFLVILLLFTEFLFRGFLFFRGYPFLSPADYIYTGFYKELEPVVNEKIRNDDAVIDILILGGSVISNSWSSTDSRLDTLLGSHYRAGTKFAFYNVAYPGHTSLDNLFKYELLEKQRFDLVIYYEAINENRVNNIPPADFKKDYSHVKWYYDIELLRSHPEVNLTVIPYVSDMAYNAVKNLLTGKIFLGMEKVDPQYREYGKTIKSAAVYKQNLDKIIEIARARKEKLLFLTFASYFPQILKLTGEESDVKYFSKCKYATKTSLWGEVPNVQKGIFVHNGILRELAQKNNISLMDMAQVMPQDSSFFCDVCHFNELGAQRFARELSSFILKKDILSK